MFRRAFSTSTRAPLEFGDKAMFSKRPTRELLRAALVFSLASSPLLVRNARPLINASYRILGKRLTEFGLRLTFFGHFCGGTDLASVMPTVHRLEGMGIGSILDYAAEKDVDDEHDETEEAALTKERRKRGVMSARTFMYEGEEQCDWNKTVFLRCIEHVAASSPNAFAAVKVTALGRPELLKRISNVLLHSKMVFREASRSGTAEENKQTPESGPLGTYRELRLTKEQLKHCLAGVEAPEEALEEVWTKLDLSKDGLVSFEEWMAFMNPLNSEAQMIFAEGEQGVAPLEPEEQEEMRAMLARVEEVAAHAAKLQVRLMIDAEQSYFQDAIDLLVRGLQSRYNREFPSIYNTYQCYLRNAHSRVVSDLRHARQEGYLFAAKVVRGAYMVQERQLAKERGLTDPIWPTLDATHASYHAVADLLLRNTDQVAVMFATHNEESVQHVVSQMDAIEGLDRDRIAFGQLLGMCDQVSLTLGTRGYKVYKYVPYGPIKDVVPYLVRRAEENSTLLGSPGVLREKQMIFAELRRRLRDRF